ncbi:TetR/AcrR family transcriptional regulator [Paenibacillus oralis]|uniref:TetR/AcrR family transcriptional regulator n=1 Tax=Paenibacillus oralis TaxID=2490856 RepID=A0A3P3U8G9_9BACL|nr:TetR/AcrR family transcriptional regulator [Paenibacillus oralis]RRJ64763.1 TetR/AcrR family transcriptional regulator [Paenibacillus oralis]
MEDKKIRIYECGKELFGAKGFKDTNVADITRKAGVSVGTFYNCYSSKEKLFMEIFLEENARLKKNLMESADLNEEPLRVIQGILVRNQEGMKSHPILKEWYNRDVFGKIEKLYREENGRSAVDCFYGDSLELVKRWQAEGKMRGDIDSEMIMAMFAAIISIDTHKEEIGLANFPQLLDYMTEFIMDGLTRRSQ